MSSILSVLTSCDLPTWFTLLTVVFHAGYNYHRLESLEKRLVRIENNQNGKRAT